MKPIIPMEPKVAKSLPQKGDWIAQVKWDGVRIQTYYDGSTVELYNRKSNARTKHYPELIPIHHYCNASSVILDGEVIALGEDGKPSFHEVMRRDGLRRMEKVEMVKKVVPISYMIFDVLYWNGQWIVDRPLVERQEILARIILPNESIQLVTSHQDADTLLDVMKIQGMEGIVMKQKNSPYLIGEKRDLWLKIKNIQDVNAVIGGFTTREGMINALLLGLYDTEGGLWYIGHAGSAKWTKEEWIALSKELSAKKRDASPFVNRPEKGERIEWVEPTLTVKVHFLEWTAGKSLRQPTIQGLVQVAPTECRFE